MAKSKSLHVSNDELGIRIPVGVKLVLIVSILTICSMVILTYVSSFFYERETRNRVKDTNVSLSRTVGKQAEKELSQLLNSGNLLFQIAASSRSSETLVDDFFTNSSSLIYVGIPGRQMNFSNRIWFRSNRIFNEEVVLQNILSARSADFERARNGETIILNASPLIPNLDSPILVLATPFLLGMDREALVILADVGSSLAESVRTQEGLTTTMIVNSSGEILAHPDYSKVFDGDSLWDTPVFQEMYTMGLSEGQITYDILEGDQTKRVMGSYSMIPLGNLGVVTTVIEDEAFSIVRSIKILNWSLMGVVLSIVMIAIYFFSKRISQPLKELTIATRQIKNRNFEVSIEPRTHDEIGQLTRNFMSMVPELEKVDRLQERTSKFVNPQVARMISDNTLPEKAETKQVTVFFSDVRGFTAMSEAMGDPQLVLENLSSYFQAMVPCVQNTGGTVDKFIGDAVMAVWGSMVDLPNSAESAINGGLEMRKALLVLNRDRGTVNRPFFQIGCGLNTGAATVGLMGGGSAKEEWAHMGDTVNLASRIETLNKPMGTDILISQNTYDEVRGIFDIVPMNKIMVKGKKEAQQIYAVLGRLDDETRPRTLGEMRALVGIQGDFEISKEMEAANEHEVKYEILEK